MAKNTDIGGHYARTIYEQFKLYTAWPPGQNIQLGDYGVLTGKIFKKKGNIRSTFGVKISESSARTKVAYEFASKGVDEKRGEVEAAINSGTPINASAKTELTFSTGNSVYFRAARNVYHTIENRVEVEQRLMEQFAAKKWDGLLVFVHDLIKSDGATIVVSSAGNASIEVKATAQSAQLDLTNARAGLEIIKKEILDLPRLQKRGSYLSSALPGSNQEVV